MAQRDYLGRIFPSKNYGHFKVISYKSAACVTVQFLDTGYTTVTDTSTINKGAVKDKFMPSVVGVGIVGDTVVEKTGVGAAAYQTWRAMLHRCYSNKVHERQPTYEGCTVAEDFKFFPTFKKWFEQQPFWEDFELDKDLLHKGNTVYSPETCCLLPKEINLMLCSVAQFGCCTIISYLKRSKSYELVWASGKKSVKRTLHKTYGEAFEEYKLRKEAQLRSLATAWKDQLSVGAYNALMSYTVYSEARQ